MINFCLKESYSFKKCWLIFIIILTACVITEAAGRKGWLDSMENIYYDLWHQLAGQRFEPQNVVIAAIDDKTLLAHPNEPLVFWSPYFAKAIKVLREAEVRYIGIDFIFSISVESWLKEIKWPDAMSRTFDIHLREQLNSGDAVLIGTIAKTENGEKILLPVRDYLFSLPGNYEDIGLANLYPDNDEIIRLFTPKFFDDGRFPSLTFAMLLAKKSLQKKGMDSDKLKIPETPGLIPIGYAGPPGTFPRICFENLLSPDALSDPQVKNLKDKIIIIAKESSGIHDIHLTPYMRKFSSRGKRVMTGAEVHANIVETILTGSYPRRFPAWLNIVWLAVFVSAGTITFFKVNPVKALGYVFLLSTGASGCAYLLFLKNWILPAAGINIALIFSYICATGLRLTKEEKVRSQLQKAIGPYVSDAIVNKILNSSKLPDLGGETLVVTVLFSDIRSFTTISEQLESREVVEILNQYYTRVCEPILEQGGMIDKFIGDAVMAIFGAPAFLPDHALRSLKAAVEMKEIAADFQNWLNKRFPDKNLPPFRIGIGINSGQAVIGNIGSSKRMGYTAIGDTVNIASRLESFCKQSGWTIVASRYTADCAGNHVKTGKTSTIKPSGRTGHIEVVEILGIEESA